VAPRFDLSTSRAFFLAPPLLDFIVVQPCPPRDFARGQPLHDEEGGGREGCGRRGNKGGRPRFRPRVRAHFRASYGSWPSSTILAGGIFNLPAEKFDIRLVSLGLDYPNDFTARPGRARGGERGPSDFTLHPSSATLPPPVLKFYVCYTSSFHNGRPGARGRL
jgi:hypothetical protein